MTMVAELYTPSQKHARLLYYDSREHSFIWRARCKRSRHSVAKIWLHGFSLQCIKTWAELTLNPDLIPVILARCSLHGLCKCSVVLGKSSVNAGLQLQARLQGRLQYILLFYVRRQRA